MPNEAEKTLILGVGNSLLTDDGFGVHVLDLLNTTHEFGDNVLLRDGGTIGLSLLPDIEDCDHLIVVDAANIGEKVGTLKVFQNQKMDEHLSRHKSTVHEVALVDLLFAARLSGRFPKSRTLIAVQPQNVQWGVRPTPEVENAIPLAIEKILEIVEGQMAL